MFVIEYNHAKLKSTFTKDKKLVMSRCTVCIQIELFGWYAVNIQDSNMSAITFQTQLVEYSGVLYHNSFIAQHGQLKVENLSSINNEASRG